ncbi:Midasin [Metarhizium album ARSEF 1941]|uniref:Midasin n=1 Tax=Metarhizium album (strain ARSEF 1941) TaxID=1081103 RepID=A0A0B2X0Y4_METAS|nr:Midasin [Metarhizium album ARSEF 1941]KHN99534.1 Midasin [Metarhizium album ARSEF 1941]
MIDVSRQKRSLLADATVRDLLPPELLDTIRQQSTTKLLDAVTQAALCPPLTERVFVHFENVFPDICARLVLNATTHTLRIRTAACFARLLPFAPYLASFLGCTHDVSTIRAQPSSLQLLLPAFDQSLSALDGESLLESLTTAWRLLNFDFGTYSLLASASHMQTLFRHESLPVRYLAIRVFCLLLHASDFKLEALVHEYVGKEEAVIGNLDGVSLDFGFLSLYEQDRAQRVLKLQNQLKREENTDGEEECLQTLTPYVVSYGSALLPRPRGPVDDSSLVMTNTTIRNLERLANLLRSADPILVYGTAGAGKTSLIHEVATQLGMYSNMVTLHLNDQTDAKMLVGLYATDSKPGSFQWRPGVLTTAVREGRWVLVEDLDRAPTEVLSTLLPLVERRELLIPSRGERIKAACSFRLLATVRTSRGLNGRESLPSLVGMRFWQTLNTDSPTRPELEKIVLQTYPILRKFAPGILAVHGRLAQLGSNDSLMSRGRTVMDRQVNLRDLLKWCRRLKESLLAAGSRNGDEPISETTRDWMFMEALDCFVGSCPDVELGKLLTYAIAEEMHLSKDRADHYLSANIPPLEESGRAFCIGRAQLRKKKLPSRLQKSKRPFASTAHAKRLLEQIAVAVKLEEPVLLVGETGIGKTTVVQQLADSLGHKLIAVNLSQQSEVGDLLGGFKPVNVRSLAVPLKEEFEDLFAATGISASKNQKYLEHAGKCFAKSQWSKLSKLWKEAPKIFTKIVAELEDSQGNQTEARDGDAQPTKRRKTQSKLQTLLELRPRWDSFARSLEQFDVQISGGSGAFAFSFVEGNLVKAVRNGDWVLLDEINLASPDTLESIADLLTGPNERPSILLSETGEIEKIAAHPDFRIFGAMNPATDVGKRDLPIGIRSRFTELYVKSPDTDLKDLLTIIKTYMGSQSTKSDQAADDIARLYLNTKRMAEERRLVDGANEVPHFSLRTLTRVLSYVRNIAPLYGIRRALYEGFSMGFLTLLDRNSEKMLLPLIYHHLLDKRGNPQSLLSQPPKHPNDGRQYVKFQNRNHDRHYWLFQGNQTPVERGDYIITPYVERNLLNLVRATSTRRFPILIQGPTSSGKTSMIEYLANFTGNKFVRINNHEHTDLQEYLGTYVSGPDGKLRFQEGLLVQAMRQGHWIVLDELNLAPTDVLEALNRLLDDNRELLIPETQEIVRPHENFILFATQNPPGLYGGRKVLSRAFRNRFLELHFDDIPEDELEYILQQRSRNTSPPDCRRIVTVYKELSRLRQTSRLFEQKDSFATLRDLFRWALREADTREEIAAHGYMLLAERVRNEDERIAVKEVIEKVFKVKLDPQELYSTSKAPELKHVTERENSHGVVWTHAMRRLYVLVSRALRNNEPVLLVGETGCGKTTVVQLLAETLNQELHIVNAHQNTETGDLIGSQRPVRNRGAILEAIRTDLMAIFESLGMGVSTSVEENIQKYNSLPQTVKDTVPQLIRDRLAANESRSRALFEWSDGALVSAMRNGHFFLLDEISLADDSVLERLNSVLEPQRTLLLAEKGVDNASVVGANGFQFFATMNPGGDFGKKELSPALRNRFTEIWVPPLSESEDIYDIVRTKLVDGSNHLVDAMVNFASWFAHNFRSMATSAFSVREILVWVQFINSSTASDPIVSFVHGASAIFIDSIGANPSAMLTTDLKSVTAQRLDCLKKLGDLIGQDVCKIYPTEPILSIADDFLSIGDFSIPRDPIGATDPTFAFHAPTTRLNAMRVVRALQMQKPILLEGSPGVGKTTLVAALSQACGRSLTRINLSDQTDLMDLFGTDVPVEGEEAGNFAWRDAPFLQAMQKGEWVLLDEMNLASQSVLEGLNACLDHRGEVYISELDQVFKRHPDFRLFAAQNPHHQGGGRKGLPSSFVNRFIVVYADVFKDEDLKLIASHNFPQVGEEVIAHLIEFVSRLEHHIVVEKDFGSQGGPWEFNLRDVLRWLQLLRSSDPFLQTSQMQDFLDIIVRQRFRTSRDRQEVDKLFTRVIGSEPRAHNHCHNLNSRFGQVGLALLSRNLNVQPESLPNINIVPRLAELESIMICVKQNIPCILGGPSGYGKSSLLSYVAALSGKPLVVFPMNADIDTMDLVGGFEQADPLREVNAALMDLRERLQDSVMTLVPSAAPGEVLHLLHLLDRHNGVGGSLDAILTLVTSLIKRVSLDTTVGAALATVKQLLEGPLVLANPRFEWLDGVIVKALLTGQWLVLDNANMCNASVLDRLNSLLEPNGFLSINEHCQSDGKPRIIRPHRDFRIFLTMDPKYGELSRAMRNRAIEIHIHSPPPESASCLDKISAIESGLQRYHHFKMSSNGAAGATSTGILRVAAENLSLDDVVLLGRFVSQGAADEPWLSAATHLLQFLQTTQGSHILRDLMQLHSACSARTFEDFPRTQSIHPLNNEIAIKLLENETSAFWMGTRYETSRRLHYIRQNIQRHHSQAHSAKLGSLSRLQRSLISERVAAVSKDSTVKLAVFLSSIMAFIEGYLDQAVDSIENFFARCQLLEILGLYLELTICLSSSHEFDEAYFQAHVGLGARKLEEFSQAMTGEADSTFLSLALGQLRRDFYADFQLSTGLSMEVLWYTFRPIPITNRAVFDRSIELDQLALRFDTLRWKVSASIVDLSKAQQTLATAYKIVRDDAVPAEQLVADLIAAIQDLETRTGQQAQETTPFFATEFEHLRQLSMLQSLASGNSRVSELDNQLVTLSNLPTKAIMTLASASDKAYNLQSLSCLSHQGIFAWDGRLTTSLWQKLHSLNSVNLNSLALLETELPVVGQHLVSLSREIFANPLVDLNNLLCRLILETFGAHSPQVKETLGTIFSLVEDNISSISSLALEGIGSNSTFNGLLQDIDAVHLRQATADHFIPSVVGIIASRADPNKAAYFSALAWVQFSIGLGKLYIPDRIFDPQLRPKVELEFFEQLQASLQAKLAALKAFQTNFTGQDTSARTHLVHLQLDKLGPAPEEIQPVFRPERSELHQLHAEFSNILKTITGPGLSDVMKSLASDSDDRVTSLLQLIRENISRLVDRLSSRFEAYQDMGRPAVSILRCLLVGLSLCDTSNAATLEPSTLRLVESTPFFGSGAQDVPSDRGGAKSFEFLSLMSANVAVGGLRSLSTADREAVFACFHSFYDDWNKKLDADRKAEAARTSMYRFRGTLEDEEEFDVMEFNELFPTFDNEDSTVRKDIKPDRVRDISLKVADAHRKIFFEQQDPQDALRESCMATGQRVVDELQNHANIDHKLNSKMLTSTLLLLGEKTDELQSSSSTETYNFYTDANLAETRKLVFLAHRIKARFRELQLVDEIGHMQPLADVIQSCDKLLEQVHGEPLAKLLPRIEQLHAHVYEWQFGGWASKTYAVLSLHNSLTETVIRWRRLELSTWANLFDMELKKCQDDAYSWWFVAYQVVIAVPLTMVDSRSEMQVYARSLIENLELYFSSSIVGQFKTRVSLLRQLLGHLNMLAQDYPALDVVCVAVDNFVQYYTRFERTADEAIRKGRTPIDKTMKDVLLMASWKDTNINALRESARKSHQKLFRLIRKFRGVLGQEMKVFMAQGLPDEAVTTAPRADAEPVAPDLPIVTSSALNASLPGWLAGHKRLANLPKTLSVMRKVTCSPEMSSNMSKLVADFVNELNTSMAELRKETPSIANDENKDQIKHLKTRKRKLLADTLRDLRTMGLQHHLSQDKLAEQNSLAVVLSSLATVKFPESEATKEAEYYLHKTLDLAPRAREAAREHSEDLTGAEVTRSIGFVEGLISLNLTQRQSLGAVTQSREGLRQAVQEFKNLGNDEKNGRLVLQRYDGDWTHQVQWLDHGIRFAIRVIEMHGKIGKIDNENMVQELQEWATRMAARTAATKTLVQLPVGISSLAHDKLRELVLRDLDEIDQRLGQLVETRADLAFILSHLATWTRTESVSYDISIGDTKLDTFADAVSCLADTVLVAIENAEKKGVAVLREPGVPGWLTKHSEAFFAMIKQLRMSNVERTIRHCTSLMRQIQLDNGQTSTAAVCIVNLASPILDQFLTLCSRCIGQGLELHRASAHMAYNLTKAFNQLASQGFCTPQEKSDETSGDAGKLEAGTGLGDGEGAQDISKDVQPDEDLTELAQEANEEKSEDIQDEKDAVDMADEDLEGELNSVAGIDEDEGSQKDEEKEAEENDMDEEAGDVDDLDPTAVDEKMWEGNDDEKAEKDQQGNEAKGQQQDEEQVAADEDTKQKDAEREPEAREEGEQQKDGEDTEESEAEEEDLHAQEELNRQDQNVQENDALELPEDMELDFDQKEETSDDDDLDDLSDPEGEADQPEDQAAEKDEVDEDMEDAAGQQLKQEAGEVEDEINEDEEEVPAGADEVKEDVESDVDDEAEDQSKEETAEDVTQPPRDNANTDVDNAAPSDAKSAGLNQNQPQESMDMDDNFQAQVAEQEQGDMGDGAADQDTSTGSKGATSRSNETVDKSQQAGDAENSARSDPFRKLGDALEKWHRQNADIMDSNQEESKDRKADEKESREQGRQEYQHLQNDDAAADAQAMGTAEEDEVQPIDETMAVDDEGERDGATSHRMEEDAEDEVEEATDEMDLGDSGESDTHDAENGKEADDGRTGVQTRQGNYKQETPSEADADAGTAKGQEQDAGSIEETSEQLSTTRISDEARSLRDYGECVQQWSEFQTKSHGLSLNLTSQLRLILTPSQSTKLSGAFRTGKRLNIKRIIPYIASSYKRDKIWMRRAIPTKRTYQILLCVDDSRSMGESSSGSLAMESLVMVSRSLAMLEAGQVGVVGFGGDVFTAHELTEPFGADAGARVLQRFNFSQDRTDIALLIRQTIDKFRTARQQAGGDSDLWQLALILSDGLTPSSAHDPIRRLLREAMEERIMVVFIIMDDTGKRKGDSVLELKEAKFVKEDSGESRVTIERYLDTFPFQYYLIVHHLEELPTALAGLLRTWFAEVTS